MKRFTLLVHCSTLSSTVTAGENLRENLLATRRGFSVGYNFGTQSEVTSVDLMLYCARRVKHFSNSVPGSRMFSVSTAGNVFPGTPRWRLRCSAPRVLCMHFPFRYPFLGLCLL